MIFAGATNETALAHSFPYSILFHFPGRSDSAHRISNITFIILNIKQSHLRVTAKNKIRLSTVSKKQLQTMVVVVSVVQFHMTTRLNFTLVSLSTSKTSEYLQKNLETTIDVIVTFDTCHGLISPFTSR